MLAIQADGVNLLALDNALAPATGHPQDMLGDFGEALPCARLSQRSVANIGVIQHGLLIFVRHLVLWAERARAPPLPPIEAAASFSIRFGVGIRQLAVDHSWHN
ncbi:hypothetical protein CQ13_31205 [Bradyrhizobium retamae]|uniref:Uncharacterized protein n=1 Tax=Bradyrhizobium retamae TaxID=1300035 RepID=A0A0R3ML39_9BRAD|nr:hypothetical protein CQ13_31205 [Bradyrhizobium retamae]